MRDIEKSLKVVEAWEATPKLRFEGFDGLVNTGYASVDTCEALNIDTFTDAAVFVGTLDTVTFKKGAGSTKLQSLSSAASGQLAYKVITSANWSTSTRIGLWIKANKDMASGDLRFYVYDNSPGAQYVSIPALVANVWKYVSLDISGLTRTAVTRYGLQRNCAVPFTAWVDAIVRFAAATGARALSKTPIPDSMTSLYIVKANTAVHTFATLTEDTDYINGCDTKLLIFITDQSANVLLVLYASSD